MEYSNNGMPTSNSYSSLPSIAPQQLQQNASLPPQTLPPLGAPHAAMSMHSMYGQQPLSAPHTPTTTTPNTPNSTNNGGFQQMNNSQSGPRGYQLQGGPSYQPPMQSYSGHSSASNTPTLLPQTTGPMSHGQAIAPAPPQQNRLVPLRPMSSAPMHGQHGMNGQMQPGMVSPYGQPAPEEQPTHVVGSQGRRGILPSAPGRPQVTATGPGASRNAMIPAKDADGKFPCPHCTKTYLHAKHLKRHLLRHTGDRPYMCVLCRDTFSRSDILKRHFQKCSIRRGNPTGASHLSHAQAHLKKSHPGPHKTSASSSADGDMMRNINGGNVHATDPSLHPFGVIVDQNLGDEQANQDHMSRANSISRMNSTAGRDRRSLTGPIAGGSSRQSFDNNYSGEIPSSMAPNMNPQIAGYNMSNGHNGPSFTQNYDFGQQNNNGPIQSSNPESMGSMANGRGPMPMYGGGSGAGNAQQQSENVHWQMFQQGAQHGYSPFNSSSLGKSQMELKQDPSLPHPNNNYSAPSQSQGSRPTMLQM